MMNQHRSAALLDHEGHPLLDCADCGSPLSASDLGDVGLPLPNPADSAEDYCDAQLLDPRELRHLHCLEAELADAQ